MPTSPKKKSSGKQQPDFEKAFAELEATVELLESGDLSLEESIKKFEEGAALIKTCQKSLNRAEKKVRQLLEKDGVSELVEWDEDDAQDDDDDPR